MTTQQSTRGRILAAIGGAAVVAAIGMTVAPGIGQAEGIAQSPLGSAKLAVSSDGEVFAPPVTAPQQTFDPQD
ncbi:hypothetical protein [Mycolicibacterium bacteremicum]|uniref:hypothetical protein n=1 Tax=Mycolicibacterium bacteremicum TaxID=564198 RepID=UPI00105603AC|nr:hypothetical protein [Mycolicibacterium bacteremicum]MCV7433114.1 hypothetical protein [Mycolicibacterium bacteremicum]